MPRKNTEANTSSEEEAVNYAHGYDGPFLFLWGKTQKLDVLTD